MDLKDLPEHLEGSTFRAQSSSVTWYSKTEGSHNVIHIMVLSDQFLMGGWVNGRSVFKKLSTLAEEEKAAFIRLLLV